MKNNAVSIEYVPIAEIKAYENNPRKNADAVEKVAQSIQTFGIRVPAIIDANNVLIAGHTRVMAAARLGITEFPCVRADDLTKNEAKAFRLADNRMQEDSEWDIETLAHEFAELKKTGYDLTETGFDEFELDGIDLSTVQQPVDDGSEEEEADDEDDTQAGSPGADTGEFVCIVCCQNDDDKALLKEIIGESDDLQKRYTVANIREMQKAE